ncbi:MAG: AI-2E family transporter [Candidatus Auribacterota bacterium]
MPTLNQEQNRLLIASLMTIALLCICAMLFYASSILIPFVMAVFIYLVFSPMLDFLVVRLKFPRSLAVLVTLSIVFIILFLMFLFASQAIQTIVATAGNYSDSFVQFILRCTDRLQKLGLSVRLNKLADQLQSSIPGLVTNTFGTVIDLFSSTLLVAIFVIFMLAGRVPHVEQDTTYAEIEHKVRMYIITKTSVSAVTGLLVWLTLSACNLQLANVFGFCAFLFNFIPNIGSVIATLLPIPIAVVQYSNPWMILLVILLPGTVQMVVGNGIEPKLMGHGLKLHPVTILLSLSFWGLLWGIPGMFLAAPITAAIRIIFMKFDTLKPIGDLLEGKLPKSIGNKPTGKMPPPR